MCSIDLEPCEVWSETTRKARKQYECYGCGAVISPGDLYLVHFDVFDGETNSEKCCAACYFERDAFATAHGQSFLPSMLEEQLRDCIEGDPDENEWRPFLASLLKRHRTSPIGRHNLRSNWAPASSQEKP